MTMSSTIYTGIWTDWSRGRVAGATITLSSRDAGFLLAFIAAFVTVIATRLWRILSFAAYHALASNGRHDGLHYQRQFVLRNTTSPMGAAWVFLLQSWHWRGVANRSFLRTFPWAAFGLLYVIAFGILAVFSSQISDSATEYRLVGSGNCGLANVNDSNALQIKEAYDNLQAGIYSRQCYQSSPGRMCQALPTPSLSWINESVACPFADSICLNSSVLKMKTEMIDSHLHLGINEPKHNRIKYKRETICAPLITHPGFVQFVTGAEAKTLDWKDNELMRYLYGPVSDDNYTYAYSTRGRKMNTGYSVWVYYSVGGIINKLWRPIKELDVGDGDISLFMIAPNSVRHRRPNSDPVFGASIFDQTASIEAYLPDRWVSPIACVDTHQICNPNNDKCTPLQGSSQLVTSFRGSDLELNKVQLVTAERLSWNVRSSSFYRLVWTRTQNFLKVQELVAGLTQLPIPSNQWEIEMSSVFSDALSKLQHQVLEFATGPAAPTNISILRPWVAAEGSTTEDLPFNNAFERMCRNQRTKVTEGTVNFSVVGFFVLLGLGLLITVISFFLESIAAFFQKKMTQGVQEVKGWDRDESLQVMKSLFELKGAGEWKGTVNNFPTTQTGERFEYNT